MQIRQHSLQHWWSSVSVTCAVLLGGDMQCGTVHSRLRTCVQPQGPRYADSHTLLRFLRARDYDIPKAVAMFTAHLKWRQENDVDTVLTDFDFNEREQYLAVYPQGYYNTDKKGRPVSIQHLGQINPKRIMQITSEDRMIRYHIQEYERFLRTIAPVCSRVAGRHIDQTMAILDVKGAPPARAALIAQLPSVQRLTSCSASARVERWCRPPRQGSLEMQQPRVTHAGVTISMLTGDVRKFVTRITGVAQDHYPETMAETIIINAPISFRLVWSAVKPLLQPRTVNKITLLGTKYMDELAQRVDIQNIPSYLGGQCKNTLLDDVGPWSDQRVLDRLGPTIDEAGGGSSMFSDTSSIAEPHAHKPPSELKSVSDGGLTPSVRTAPAAHAAARFACMSPALRPLDCGVRPAQAHRSTDSVDPGRPTI